MAEHVLAGAVEVWADDPYKVVSVGDVPVLVLRQGEEKGDRVIVRFPPAQLPERDRLLEIQILVVINSA